MSAESDDDRTTAVGLYYYACSYHTAAAHLFDAKLKHPHVLAPIKFLYFHSIELFMKSLLRLNGHTVQDIYKLRHRIDKIADELTISGFHIANEERFVIDRISKDGTIERSRYIKTGRFQEPWFLDVMALSNRLRIRTQDSLRSAGKEVT